jgi:hypothetical protein
MTKKSTAMLMAMIWTSNANAGSPKGFPGQCLMPQKQGQIREPLISIGGRMKVVK